jgi:hypothetical protein
VLPHETAPANIDVPLTNKLVPAVIAAVVYKLPETSILLLRSIGKSTLPNITTF